ncbi:MAG: DUF4124 domain-containing protein [Nitrospirae bacterium]|nr:MAG: DUF4124 domain-containing protein [Nitrospirota bacterium]
MTKNSLLIGILMIFGLGLFSLQPVSAAVYKYVDKDGVESYTDSLQAVPEKHRKKAVEVKGLREKDETAKASGPAPEVKQEAPQGPSKTATARLKAKAAAEGFMEKGYWKPVALFTGLIIVFMIIGKLGRTMGSGPIWMVVKMAVALAFLVGAYYMYSKEIADMFASMRGGASGLEKQVEKVKGRGNRTGTE